MCGVLVLTSTKYPLIKRVLSRLMANPDKPVHIPKRQEDKDINRAPEFNHNIMGR